MMLSNETALIGGYCIILLFILIYYNAHIEYVRKFSQKYDFSYTMANLNLTFSEFHIFRDTLSTSSF